MPENLDSSALDSLITSEEKLVGEYDSMMNTANMDNIRRFLDLFRGANKSILKDLKALKSPGAMEKKVRLDQSTYLHATDHLNKDQFTDLNSLRSVLLFITEKESSSYSTFSSIVGKITNSLLKENLIQVLKKKENLRVRADTLYNDLVMDSF
jgi:hypothetical protein